MSNSYNPTNCSLPGSSVHGVLQARILEQVAISLLIFGLLKQFERAALKFLPTVIFVDLFVPSHSSTSCHLCISRWCYQLSLCSLYVYIYVYEIESESKVTQSCPTLSDPMDYSPPGPPSMGFSRQEYWSGVPLPSPLTAARHIIFTWSWYTWWRPSCPRTRCAWPAPQVAASAWRSIYIYICTHSYSMVMFINVSHPSLPLVVFAFNSVSSDICITLPTFFWFTFV